MAWDNNHEPHKHVEPDGTIFGGPLIVTCSCGWEQKGHNAMAFFRDHYSLAMNLSKDTAPKPVNTKQRTRRSRLP
jgi:hypothetical protein